MMMKAGDSAALNMFLNEHTPFINTIILQVQANNSATIYQNEELFKAGKAGLKKAFATNDEDRFKRFFLWYIKQSILQFLKK